MKFINISLLLLPYTVIGLQISDFIYNQGRYSFIGAIIVVLLVFIRIVLTNGKTMVYTQAEVDRIKDSYGAFSDLDIKEEGNG